MKRLLAATLVGAGLAAGQLAGAAPAQACQIDAAWFFLHQCNNPPPPPDQPPWTPTPIIACDENHHCGPDVPIPSG